MISNEVRDSIRVLACLVRLDLRHLNCRITNPLLLGSLILLLLGFLLTLSTFHNFASEYALLHGVSNPKYAMGGYEPMLFYACIAVSLVFALRLPSYREESHDSVVIVYRSPSNFLLALSQVVTPILFVFGTVVTLAFLYQLLAFVDVFHRPGIVEPFEPQSLAFVLLNLLVALLFWTSLATLLAQVFKSAAIGFIGTLVLLVIQANIEPLLPSDLGSFTFGYGAASLFVSDLAPNYWDIRHLFYFLSVPCLAFALVNAVATLNVRSDPSKRTVYTPLAAVLATLCVVSQAVVHGVSLNGVNQHRSWIQAFDENARSTGHPVLVKTVRGNVKVKPGSRLTLQLQYTVELRDGSSDSGSAEGSTLIFGFNPGMKVERIRCSGLEVDYTHKKGILEIDIEPCEPIENGEYAFELAATGKPVPHYLVGHIPRIGHYDLDPQMLRLMGQRSSIFTSDYVALTPLSHWYPRLLVPPSSFEELAAANPRDFSLTIELSPKSWTMVTTGGAVFNDEDSRNDVVVLNGKFHSIGLLAADFRIDTHSVESTDVNVLVHKRHAKRLDRNKVLTDGLVKRVTEALSKLQSYGIEYPREQFSIVEIPDTLTQLNWENEQNVGLESIMVYRESGLPFASTTWLDWRYELAVSNESDSDFHEQQLGFWLGYFWTNPIFNHTYEDVIIGSLLGGRVDWANETSALAGLVLESLLLNLLDSSEYRFDFDLANSIASESRVNLPYVWAQRRGQSGNDLRDFETTYLASNAYWDSIERLFMTPGTSQNKSHGELRLSKRAQRLRVLKLGELLGDSFEDETIAAMLSAIMGTNGQEPVSMDHLIHGAENVDMDIESLVQNTLLNTKLAGVNFAVAQQVESEVPNEHGHRFKTVLEFRNSEDTVGYVTFLIQEVRETSGGDQTFRMGTNFSRVGPFELEAKSSYRLAVNTEDLLWPLNANTFLSLNRGLVRVSVAQSPITKDQIVPEDSPNGWYSFEPSLWNSETNENEVIVDDLDPGFEIPPSNYRERRFTWLLGRDLFRAPYAREEGMDNGLPVGLNPVGPWVRSSGLGGWGRYRHTYALADSTKAGIHRVSFNAEIPKVGRWSLSYHLPYVSYFLDFQRAMLGEYDIVVTVEDKEWKLAISAEDWVAGWNEIATLDIESEGRASVSVSNQNNEPYVFADAIKWTYLD